jgi:hypothetical protein
MEAIKEEEEKEPSWSSKLAAKVVSHTDAIGLVSVLGLFYVNFMFNFDYGKLMATGPDTENKFAWAFGLLETSALYLAGYIAYTSVDDKQRDQAKYALFFLLALSFWTCYSSILASDARAKWDGQEIYVNNTLDSIRDIDRQIKLTEEAIDALNPSLLTSIVYFFIDKDLPEGSLSELQDTLAELRKDKRKEARRLKREDNIERPQFAVFREVGTITGLEPETIRMISRLVFGFAVIFSYCIVFNAMTAKVLADRKKK